MCERRAEAIQERGLTCGDKMPVPGTDRILGESSVRKGWEDYQGQKVKRGGRDRGPGLDVRKVVPPLGGWWERDDHAAVSPVREVLCGDVLGPSDGRRCGLPSAMIDADRWAVTALGVQRGTLALER